MAKIHEIEGWIDKVKEDVIDPERPIIDPHHHLWKGPKNPPGIKESYRYMLEDLWRDTSSGHNITRVAQSNLSQLVKQSLLLVSQKKPRKTSQRPKLLALSGMLI